MPAYLQSIASDIAEVHTWQALQQVLAKYTAKDRQSWRGHLWVEVRMPGQRPWQGLAKAVTLFESHALPLPVKLLVRHADGKDREVSIEHLAAIRVF